MGGRPTQPKDYFEMRYVPLFSPGGRLGDDDRARSLAVAKRRLYQAGVRLAMRLNEVFGGKWNKHGG